LSSCHFFSSQSENVNSNIEEKKSFRKTALPNIDNEFAMEHERVLASWLADLESIQDTTYRYKATFRVIDYIANYPNLPLEIKNHALVKISPYQKLFETLSSFLQKIGPADLNYILQNNTDSLFREIGAIPTQHISSQFCNVDTMTIVAKDQQLFQKIYKAWNEVSRFIKAHDQLYAYDYFDSMKTLLKTRKVITETNEKEYQSMIEAYLSLYFDKKSEEPKKDTQDLIGKYKVVLEKILNLPDIPKSLLKNKTIIACAWEDVQKVRNIFAGVITWNRMKWLAEKVKSKLKATPQILNNLQNHDELLRYLKLNRDDLIQESHLDGWRNSFKLEITKNEIIFISTGLNTENNSDDLIYKLSRD
jgi:hypothetical protein